eukprot:TRINITY_DN429_c0_g1_i2.p2 TRINITY_DN429_c0_g1~~TRINITY_DN429_c0_g1_i2.p2  ORF type:complete len:423 (-),score=115.64 TRINITY_DN429_c0_g1_i2:566-1834(-)
MNGPDGTLADNGSRTWAGGAWLVLCELIGPSRYLHTALVCREWRETYACLYPKATAITAADLSIDQLLWTRAHGCRWGKHLTLLAASAGDLRLLRYLLANACPWDAHQAFGAAVSAGRAHILPCIHGMMRHLNMELWPKSTAAEWCAAAAGGGHMAVLQWLHRGGCPWDHRTCAAAARGGHLVLLQWARDNRCEWSECTCFAAASAGHLHILQWARANRCDWCGEDVCRTAARNGHLEVLLWARANGAPWGCGTALAAVRGAHLRVLRWALANGCTVYDLWSEEHVDIYANASLHARRRGADAAEALGLLSAADRRCAHHLDCERVCLGAAQYGHVEVLEWCKRNGAGVFMYDGGAAACAARAGQIEVLRWLRAHGCWSRRVVAAALNHAVRDNQVETVRWLCANLTEPQRDTEDSSYASTI